MKDKNIIIALSHGNFRDELLLYFGHNGANVHLISDNASLLKLLKSETIHCIVTQMMFGGEDSIELILKVFDINSNIPVILIDQTGKSNKRLAERLKVAAYFQKPFSSLDVFQATAKILETSNHVLHDQYIT